MNLISELFKLCLKKGMCVPFAKTDLGVSPYIPLCQKNGLFIILYFVKNSLIHFIRY